MCIQGLRFNDVGRTQLLHDKFTRVLLVTW